VTLAIDGAVHGTGSAATFPVTLTTTQTNDYIMVCVLSNGAPVVSVVGSTLGSFTQLGHTFRPSSPFGEEIWGKFSSGILSSETITVNTTSSGTIVVDAFGVSGSGQTSLVMDAGGPQVIAGNPADPVSITTVNANTMVIGAFSLQSGPGNTAGAGFTLVSATDFAVAEYKVLSATATTSVALGTPGASDGGVAVAIVASSGGGTFVLEPQQRVMM
jgi:hypothetical protein